MREIERSGKGMRFDDRLAGFAERDGGV